MFDNVRADVARLSEVKVKPYPWNALESVLLDNGFQAVLLHRLAHWFRSRRIPILGAAVARLSLFLTGVDIAPTARIGPGLLIGHGVGLVIGGDVTIGANAFLLHGVTIGAASMRTLVAMPQLGDRVFVGTGACIIGNIKIGNDVLIGVNAVVTEDVPADSRVNCVSAITVKPRSG